MEQLRSKILAQAPTDEQSDAIFTDELEFLLRASPGSGKTWTSCRRFIWRGANWAYDTGGLALLSFTNAAIKEFRQETMKMGMQNLLSDPNYVGTFDSFIERFIISPFGYLLSETANRPKLFFTERPGYRSNSNLMVWYEPKKMKIPAWEITPILKDGYLRFRKFVLSGSYELNKQYSQTAVDELLKMGFYTHSQRGYWSCVLLKKYKQITKRLAKRFPEIIVDEAQDTNPWFYYILNQLRANGSKVTVIGDPDQCIYEYNMASPLSLYEIKDKWGISEKPLSESFRCNCNIAEAVKSFSMNNNFRGCNTESHLHIPYIFKETSSNFANSITRFKDILCQLAIDESDAAILCRGHDQLSSISGGNSYNNFKGKTKLLAKAAFARDNKKNYLEAFEAVRKCLHQTVKDTNLIENFWEFVEKIPESDENRNLRLEIWRFIKSSSGLPKINLTGEAWVAAVRATFTQLISALDFTTPTRLNNQLSCRGLTQTQKTSALCELYTETDQIRYDIIHQVKGESIDAVLLLGADKFWTSAIKAALNNENTEDKRIAYVAMTRARHLLLIGLPAAHFDKYSSNWVDFGFRIIE